MMYVSYPKSTGTGFYILAFPITPSSQAAWLTSTTADATYRYGLALTSSRLYSIGLNNLILQISQLDFTSGAEQWTH
jgi:hypothetical protein